jgi:hypothetical protein
MCIVRKRIVLNVWYTHGKCFNSLHHEDKTVENWSQYCYMTNCLKCWSRRGRDRMVVGFTTIYAISAYHHWCCEFESRSRRGVQHYVIKFVSDLRQIGGFFRVLQFPKIKFTKNNMHPLKQSNYYVNHDVYETPGC